MRATLPDGVTAHCEVERDGVIVLLGRRGGPLGDSASVTQVFVDDVDVACTRAARGGGAILEAPGERPWGGRQAVVRDPQGQRWVITQFLSETDPTTWYGRLLGPAGNG